MYNSELVGRLNFSNLAIFPWEFGSKTGPQAVSLTIICVYSCVLTQLGLYMRVLVWIQPEYACVRSAGVRVDMARWWLELMYVE